MPFAATRIPALMARAEKRRRILNSLSSKHQQKWEEYTDAENVFIKYKTMLINQSFLLFSGPLTAAICSTFFIELSTKFQVIIAVLIMIVVSSLSIFLYGKRIKSYKTKHLTKEYFDKLDALDALSEIVEIKKRFKNNGVAWS